MTPERLHVLIDPALDGATNMARDEHLLHSAHFVPAALRIYRWSPPTISLGYFQRFADIGALPADVRDLAVVRRPTGGGAILHDREITYCLVVGDSLPIARAAPVELYRLVHERWRKVLHADGIHTELAADHLPMPTPRSGPFFCFEKPGRTDLLLAGGKLLGSAQRRIPGRVLQHGSLLLEQRFLSHPGVPVPPSEQRRVDAWIHAFADGLAADLGLMRIDAIWDADALADVDVRRTRYAGGEWSRMR